MSVCVNYSHYTRLVTLYIRNYISIHYAGIPLETRNLRSVEFLLCRCINYPLKIFKALNRKIQGHFTKPILFCSGVTFYSPDKFDIFCYNIVVGIFCGKIKMSNSMTFPLIKKIVQFKKGGSR